MTLQPKKILGTCALDTCTVNGGLVFFQDECDVVPIKGGHNIFHRECNPNPEPIETTEAA